MIDGLKLAGCSARNVINALAERFDIERDVALDVYSLWCDPQRQTSFAMVSNVYYGQVDDMSTEQVAICIEDLRQAGYLFISDHLAEKFGLTADNDD